MEVSQLMNALHLKKNAKIVNRFLGAKIKGKPSQLYDAASHLI